MGSLLDIFRHEKRIQKSKKSQIKLWVKVKKPRFCKQIFGI